MNRTTPKNAILIGALLGVMVAAQGMAATLRYVGSGDYNDLFSVTGVNGWQDGGTGPGGLPGSADTIRFNWGNNTVTLTNVAPDVARFQIGVDESGQLVVGSGGSLTAVGTSANRVGNNPSAAVVGRLTVYTNGVVNSVFVLEVGASCTGILTIDGGTVNLSHHLWVGSGAVGVSSGTIILTNGGTLNMLAPGGNGMLGLGTINASTASGGIGIVKVSDGSALNLYNIDPTGKSIWPGSVLDISGSGVVTIPGDRTTAMGVYTNAGRITAYGGTGTVGIDYNTLNSGKTTLFAIKGYTPPEEVVWDPAANPGSTGQWNESANWAGGLPPATVTKVVFNVVGAMPCTVTHSAAVASHLVMGTNGPGGTLIITNGGILTCGTENASVIGWNSNAVMIVENGGAATFGGPVRIGLEAGAEGMLVMNGGTMTVAGMFDMGYLGGKGTARIKGGTLNLAQWDDWYSLQGESVLDVSGTGKVVINGDHKVYAEYFVSTGQITNSVGTNVLVDYNVINVGKTTIYPAGLDLPPAQVVWNPAANPESTGLWNECPNWTGGLCPGNVTFVTFNVPDAAPCTVTNAALAGVVRMGVNGPGGTLIITNGASLTAANSAEWNAVGYNNTALMVVESGASASFGYHLWVGFDPSADGTLIINGGTVSVGQMFGLGWNGGKGTAQVNSGTLNLTQLHPTDSIKGASVLNITGTGTVTINGNQLTAVANYIAAGKITANGGPNVAYGYDSTINKTILQAAPARQAITSVSVSGGNVTLTYQTTPGHIYHLESTPALSPATWTRVPGSTTNASGASVTFTFPISGDLSFYRTVSP